MLKGNTIELRSLQESDLDFLYNIENDYRLWRFGSEKQDFSKQDLLEYIQNSKLDIEVNNQLRLIIVFKKEPVGMIDLYDYNGEYAGVGILVIKQFRRKGIAKKSLILLIDYCFNKLNLNELFCSIKKENIYSLKLFKSIGFKETGELKGLKYFKLKA